MLWALQILHGQSALFSVNKNTYLPTDTNFTQPLLRDLNRLLAETEKGHIINIGSTAGKEVYKDSTPKSLGYCTLICKPTKGKKVRIELVKETINAATTTGVEVNGKKLDDGVVRDDSKAKGTLSIIEVEVYEGRE